MRALVLSDIHSNLEALLAVLQDGEDRGGFDQLWCLGDIVGYGPDPNACLDLLRQYDLLVVAGNHDHAAIGQMGTETFNNPAAVAAHWTARQLTRPSRDFLEGLPLVVAASPFTLVHGSLRVPLMEYLLDQESAMGTLSLLETPLCLVGHSHIPFICQEAPAGPRFVEFTEDKVFALQAQRWIINAGGVGQPRDHDPRPSYAIYNSRQMTIERHRVTYNILETQKKMRQAELPRELIERLNYGV